MLKKICLGPNYVRMITNSVNFKNSGKYMASTVLNKEEANVQYDTSIKGANAKHDSGRRTRENYLCDCST